MENIVNEMVSKLNGETKDSLSVKFSLETMYYSI